MEKGHFRQRKHQRQRNQIKEEPDVVEELTMTASEGRGRGNELRLKKQHRAKSCNILYAKVRNLNFLLKAEF